MSPGAGVSLQVTLTILLTGALSQPSETETETVMGTSWWFGGERTLGVASTVWMTAADRSVTVSETPAELLFPARPVAEIVTTYCPRGSRVPAGGVCVIT